MRGQPQYVNGVNEDYHRFVDEGAASMAASAAERERLADKGIRDDNEGPPPNRPNRTHNPRSGPSPQPADAD